MPIALCRGCGKYAPEIPEIVEATEKSRHKHATAYVEAKFGMDSKGFFICSPRCQQIVDDKENNE